MTASTTAIPGQTPRCNADQLAAVFSGSAGLTDGQMMAGIVIGNRGPTCFLEGYPAIQVFDRSGGEIALKVANRSDRTPAKVVVVSGTSGIMPYASIAGTASVSFSWPTHDGAGSCSPLAQEGTYLRIRLPYGGGYLDVPVIDPRNQITIAPCGGNLYVGPFEAVAPPAPPVK
jgi:hypothetical protein